MKANGTFQFKTDTLPGSLFDPNTNTWTDVTVRACYLGLVGPPASAPSGMALEARCPATGEHYRLTGEVCERLAP